MMYKLLKEETIYKKTKAVLLDNTASKVSLYFSNALEKLIYSIRDDHRLNDILDHIQMERLWNLKNISKENGENETSLKKLINDIIGKVNVSSNISKEKLKCQIESIIIQRLNINQTINQTGLVYLENLLKQTIEKKIKIDKTEIDTMDKLYSEIADEIKDKLENVDDLKKEASDYFTRYIILSSAIIASLFHDIGYPVVHYFGLQKRLQSFSPPIYMLINGDKSSYEKIAATLSQSLVFQVVSKEEIVKRCENGDHGTFSSLILLLHFYESGLIFSLPLEQRTAIELAALAIYNHTNKYEFVLGEKKHYECHYYKPIFNLNPISFLLRLCDDAQEWERTYFEICDTQSLLYCRKCLTPIIRKTKPNQRGNGVNYHCRCEELQVSCFKNETTDFNRRIIYNVCPSSKLKVCFSAPELKFNFQYDYFWLLRMCSINTSYAVQRTKELNYIKKVVSGQDIGYSVKINFRMSFNPVLLKSWIIGEYIDKNPIHEKVSLIVEQYAKEVSNNLKERFNKQLEFYHTVYKTGVNIRELSDVKLQAEQLYSASNFDHIDDCTLYDTRIIEKMLQDAFLQYYRENSYQDAEEKFMESNKSLRFDMNCYCDPENKMNSVPTETYYPDYYSDLFLFECMNKNLYEKNLR